MRLQDIPEGMRLKAIAGWNQTEADWRLFLSLNPAGCFVAEDRGRIAGTVTTTDYGEAIAWIGMVLVDPDFRRQGIATRLTLRAIESVTPGCTIKLDATPLGQQVYEPLGFQTESTLYRLTIGAAPSLELTPQPNPTPEAEVAQTISALAVSDLAMVGELDRLTFGADRLGLLSIWATAQPQTAWQCHYRGALRGYCLGRPGTNFYQLGPLVAETPAEAIALAGAALGQVAGQPVVIDAPAAQTAFLAWLAGLGFERQRSFARMVYGQNHHPGQPEKVFAAAGPEFG
jgi:GNAT superfamily N-acetyltransferase